MQDLVTGMQFRGKAGKRWFQIHRLKGCFPAYLDVASDEVEVREAAPASFLLPSFGDQLLRAARATAGPEVGENLSLLW